jgi:SAM-dependent methyltransferase
LDPADVPTPPPTVRELAAPEPVGSTESGRAIPGALSGPAVRRSGPTSARERSGPIGIASGDFATPVVRRRITTQPRGIPVSAPEPPPSTDSAAREAPPAPAPQPANGTPPPASAPPPLASTPPPLASTPPPLASAPPPPTPAPEQESPFVVGALPDLGDQAALLVAEAAAVRALDSGPITPPPQLLDPGPTPPPAQGAGAEAASAAPTPAPEPDVTSPPEPEPSPPAPLAVAPEPDAGAIPTNAMGDGPDAVPSHPPIEEPAQARSDEDGEVAGDDDLEMIGADGSGDGLASDAMAERVAAAPTPPPVAVAPRPPPVAVAPRPPSPSGKTPPPIPVSSLKTPNPELPPSESDGKAGFTSIPGLPVLPEVLAQRPRRPKRAKPWFEEVFDEDYLRTLPFMSADQTLREVDFIEQSLELPAGAEVLDVGCGYGRHAIELVHRGLNVTGLDLSLPLLIRAADEAQRRSLAVTFVHGDMREIAFDKQFDGAYCMLTSFGYFDEEANLRVADGIARALKPGARLLLDVVNRDYVVGDLPSRIWWEGKGCVVLEEVDFNFHTSRIVTHRSIVFEDGRQLEQEISVRAYSLHEIGRLLRQANFRVVDVSGALATRGRFFGTTSRSLLVLAEKRSEEA